jgi:hypothetical protein
VVVSASAQSSSTAITSISNGSGSVALGSQNSTPTNYAGDIYTAPHGLTQTQTQAVMGFAVALALVGFSVSQQELLMRLFSVPKRPRRNTEQASLA